MYFFGLDDRLGGLAQSLYNARAMQYQLFVQGYANNGFVAAVIGMPDCLAEGQTKEEAIANAKAALQSRLSLGEVVTIDVEPSAGQEDNPLLKHFGRFKDDPTFEDYRADIEAYRRRVDEEEAAKS